MGDEGAQDESLGVKWQRSQEMRLRAQRKHSAETCEVEDICRATCLSVSSTKNQAPVWIRDCHQRSIMPINPLQWGGGGNTVELKTDLCV